MKKTGPGITPGPPFRKERTLLLMIFVLIRASALLASALAGLLLLLAGGLGTATLLLATLATLAWLLRLLVVLAALTALLRIFVCHFCYSTARMSRYYINPLRSKVVPNTAAPLQNLSFSFDDRPQEYGSRFVGFPIYHGMDAPDGNDVPIGGIRQFADVDITRLQPADLLRLSQCR